jgi:nucleotide-binding universal stress UspA family protein
MTHVLAVIDDTPAAADVLSAAQALALTLGTAVHGLHVREGDAGMAEAVAAHAGVSVEVVDGDAVARILQAAADPFVSVIVVGARCHPGGHRPGGHVAVAVMLGAAAPVLVVPPDAKLPDSGRFHRLLVPLAGEAEHAEARAAIVHELVTAGVDVVAVHVFDPASVPRFWDQAGHAPQSWATEFRTKWCEEPDIDLHLRSGDVAGAILHVAAGEHADVIAVGWSQDLAPDRARIVRDLLGRAEIPILLTPTRRP